MKTLVYFVMIAVAVLVCSFREPVKPDMDQIRREVNDPASPYYYPDLMKRYEQNETVMTLDDYRHLYLGYAFQEDFNPYRHSAYSSLIEEQYYKSHHSRSECDSIIKYALLSLEDEPFNLRQINYLIYALREKKKNNLANIWQFRLNHLLEAIVSTGTGLDPDNAWVVVSPQHEYDILNLLGRVAEQHEFVTPSYDHILLLPKREKDPAGYYFNVRWIIEEYLRKFPAEEPAPEDTYSDYDD